MAVGDLVGEVLYFDDKGEFTGLKSPIFEISNSSRVGAGTHCNFFSDTYFDRLSVVDIVKRYDNQTKIDAYITSLAASGSIRRIYTGNELPRYYTTNGGSATLEYEGGYVSTGTSYSGDGAYLVYGFQPSTGYYVASVWSTSGTSVSWVAQPLSATYYTEYLPTSMGKPKTVVNFYRSSSPGVIDSSPIELARGESSSQLEYTVVYEDGSYEAYSGEVSYTGEGLGTAYTIENNIITVADMTTRPSAVITAKPAAYGEDTELFTFINLTITNPNGVYDGGDSDINAPGLGPGGVGGNGSFGKNEVSDPITVPNGSTAPPISTTGMFTRYAVNVADLDTIADWLWSDDGGKAISKALISLIYGDPADSIISLMAFPFDISTVSGADLTTQNLYWGNFDTGKPMTVIRGAGASIDWGEITLEENWGNFLDYDPHTKIELYLPWGTGFVSIDPGQCLPGKLRVVTNVDLIKGSCIHNVYGNNNCVIGVYDGHCAQQYPILSSDYAAKKAGVVVAGIASAVAGAIGGGAAAAATGQLTTPMNPANNPQLGGATTPALPSGGSWGSPIQSVPAAPSSPTKMTNFKLPSVSPSPLSVAAARRPVTISRSGSFGEGSAFLGCQYPYIIVSRPTQSVPQEYGSHYGYPSNLYKRLGELTGYTEVSEIHLTGIGATSDELTEIESILKGGFIL